jgi:hypothetical protein
MIRFFFVMDFPLEILFFFRFCIPYHLSLDTRWIAKDSARLRCLALQPGWRATAKKAKWGAADSVTCIGRCYWNHASLLPASVDPSKLRQQLAQSGRSPETDGRNIVSFFSDSGQKKKTREMTTFRSTSITIIFS